MRIAALAIGTGVPAHDFAGRVSEVHARAALIKLDDGWCMTLLGSELGRQPRGVSLDLAADISLRQLLSANTQIAKRGGVIRFAASPLAIDLRQAQRWSSGIASLQLDCRDPAVASAYRTASAVLQRDGRSQTLRDMAGARLDNLSKSIRDRDLGAAERAMAELVGLGEGKTPAGDDYLVGICAALWSCSATKAFAAALGPKLVALTAGTSALSRLYLQEAARGEISERLCDVAAGICAGGSAEVIGNAVKRALSVGHSSGAAGIFGLLNGYAACAPSSFYASADPALAPTF